MPQIRRGKGRKEYVYLSESGSFHVFTFSMKAGKKYVHQKKKDIAEKFDFKLNIPLEGDFTWSYDMIFGKNGMIKWELLGEL
jgi:hypothetical protein